MPNCCVPDCKNSAEGGFLMRCFPRNEALRAEWARNINKPGFVPNHSHRICQIHFAPEMWEKTRVDGTRKLKFNAVPTIFNNRIIKESPSGNIVIPPANIDDETKVVKNNKPIIKILPPTNSTNAKPIILPASIFENQSNSLSTIIVNTEGKIITTEPVPSVPKKTSILKPQIKTTSIQSAPMIIATNASSSVLKNQIKSASNQSPIVIPASGSVLKPQFQIATQQISTQLPNIIQSTNNKRILLPLISSPQKSSTPNSNSQPVLTAVPSSAVSIVKVDDDLDQLSFEEFSDSDMNTTPAETYSSKEKMKRVADDRFEKMDKLLLKQLKLNNALRKRLHSVNQQLQSQTKKKSNDIREYLKDVFTDDQIRAIELRHTNPKSITAWSQKTMIKALKLKECCGTRGYEELLRQNMPYPSIRTISRWCTQRNIPIP